MSITLLKPYYLSFRNQRSLPGVLQRDLILLGITVVVMSCIFICTVMILSSLDDTPVLGALIPPKILELMFYVFFLLMILSNTISAIGNIYMSQNMDLLLTTPQSTPALYQAKYLETLVETCAMFVVFGLPVTIAYSYSLSVGFEFVIAAFLLSIPFVMIPVGLSVVTATAFVKFAAIFWKRGLLLFLSLGCVGAWGLHELVDLMSQVEIDKNGVHVVIQIVSLFENPNPIWLPSRWISDILVAFLSGSSHAASEKLLLLCASGAASYAFGYIFFDLFLLRIRSAAAGQSKAKLSRAGMCTMDLAKLLLDRFYRLFLLEPHIRAIIIKDLTSLSRDRAQALQLLLYSGIAVAYLVIFRLMSSAVGFGQTAEQAWNGFLASINILFAGFILSAVMTRLVYPSISLEGRSFWVLLVSPIKLSQMIRAKFWCWLPLTCLVACSLLLAGALAIRAEWTTIMCTAIIGGSLGVGLTGLAIGLGCIFASFEWESPNKIATGLGTLVLLLSCLALVLATAVPASFITLLMTIPKLRVILGLTNSFALMSLALFIAIVLNLFLAELACRKGARSLAKKVYV